MRPIRLVLEIRHSQVPELFLNKEKIFLAITGQESPINSFNGEGIRVHIKKKKMFVVVEPGRTGVLTEELSNEKNSKDLIYQIFSKLNEHLSWKKIDRVGIRSFWIHPTEENFDNFVQIFKDVFFNTSNDVLNESKDVGSFLTLYDGNNRVNFISGPMEKAQLLNEYMTYKDGTFPDRFVFVDIDYSITNTSFSDALVKDSLDKAMGYSRSKSSQVEQLFKKK